MLIYISENNKAEAAKPTEGLDGTTDVSVLPPAPCLHSVLTSVGRQEGEKKQKKSAGEGEMVGGDRKWN